MTFRNHSTTLLALATLTGCAMAPAHADVLPPSAAVVGAITERLPPGDLLGYRPAPVPSIPGGASSDRLFDDPAAGRFASRIVWVRGVGAIAGWNPPGIYAPGRGGGNNNGGNLQTGGNGNGNNGCGNGNGGPNGGGCPDRHDPPSPPTPPDPDGQPGVPGPLPVLGLGAAFACSRKLRRRIK